MKDRTVSASPEGSLFWLLWDIGIEEVQVSARLGSCQRLPAEEFDARMLDVVDQYRSDVAFPLLIPVKHHDDYLRHPRFECRVEGRTFGYGRILSVHFDRTKQQFVVAGFVRYGHDENQFEATIEEFRKDYLAGLKPGTRAPWLSAAEQETLPKRAELALC